MKKYEPKVIAIDMDGIICKGENWGQGESQPLLENIKKINKIGEKHFIIIHTARRYFYAEQTLLWLDKHNVRYHAIHFEKMPADCYIDDKLQTLDNIIKEL